jgi:hypothetical protein
MTQQWLRQISPSEVSDTRTFNKSRNCENIDLSSIMSRIRLAKRKNNCMIQHPISMCRYMTQLLGMIFCGLVGVPVAAGEVHEVSLKNVASVNGLPQHIQSRSESGKRHNPFMPIKKRHSLSSSSRKAQHKTSQAMPISIKKVPNWKLLGIVHGQYGQQAVIQVAPSKRIIVRPGMKLTKSGWIVRTIRKGEVLLEHIPTPFSGEGRSRPKTFILSFPALGQARQHSG